MATMSSTITLQFLHPIHPKTTFLHRTNHLTTTITPSLPSLKLTSHKPFSLKPLFSSIPPNSPNPNPNPNPIKFPQITLPLINSTKTLTTLFTLTLTFLYKLTKSLKPSQETLQYIHFNVVPTMGPLLFASIKNRPSGYLNTPLTVVASGMAKWLDIYSGVLMVRVLLSWFPNIPWDRQPLSAIRDLCDPYLNLFRNIIPPVFDTLDVSPLLAFAVLGTLGSILNAAKGVY